MRSRNLLRLGLLFGACCAWLTVAACSSGGGGKLQDAGPMDTFTIDYMFGDLPPGCPPGAANDKGIGAPCTKGGTECGMGGLICTCDMTLGVTPPSDTPCFCSIAFLKACTDPTVPADYCGQNASCCSYMGMASLCVPNVCLQSAMCPMF